MYKKFLLALIGTILVFSGTAQATPGDVVYYNLSLAGYRIGMTYDEAVAVRPFHYMQNTAPQMGSSDMSVFDAFVEHVYIEDVEMNVRISFIDGKINRIVARFSPDVMPEMVARFQAALGPGENKSKLLKRYDDKEIRQTVHLWDYPGAKMHLVNISSAAEFATVSLVAKKDKRDVATEEHQSP